jgi:hypothetical protein
LDFTAPPLDTLLARNSRCARLAAYLLARRGTWIDLEVLEQFGGKYAVRTRVNDLTHAPWHLSIETRVRTLPNGVKVSERRLV